ncbi:hydrogenase expression/formation protein HypE [Fictibacillus sp. b24]|uniref:hydrogenase expression/formation protein HypE n=1 Tax=Fictibacillus sp. b24 TaxID=3055863 RepID=UPI0025A173FA|nr:hydrogenase expression/formation protein HypE [Fictibacillus sp. b24]MDM5315425.1 hydrogenase expression/formation protein HypE [Fictibacillus sp. b24]
MAKRVSLAHGEGGELTHQLINDVFIKAFNHKEQTKFDSAFINITSERMAVTTDSYVVNPLFFPGGDIGKLAVTGTINDLAVSGAIPLGITAGFIIEEGFLISDLRKIVQSMAIEAEKSGVKIVAGDTKVVEKGSADGVFINTTGIGIMHRKDQLKPETIKTGDSIIISGTIGDHGIAILSARQELGLLTDVKSDCAVLTHMIRNLMDYSEGIRIMRDPTRGGLATSLVELSEDFGFTAEIDDSTIPIRDDVHGACDILGFDPLYLANEGKIVMIVDPSKEIEILNRLKEYEAGRDACVIGRIVECNDSKGKVLLKTPLGTTRRLHRLSGMLLPRIC